MPERTGLVTLKGNPLTLVGKEVKAGDKAPDFTVVANDLSEKKLSDYSGKVIILSVVPSLDTGICDASTRKFNEEAAKLGDDVVILTVSRDLPMAQKRWCGAAGVEQVETLSDFRVSSLGEDYGLAIGDGPLKGLLARAVYVIDKSGKVVYHELVPEIAQEPDYNAALEAAKSAQ